MLKRNTAHRYSESMGKLKPAKDLYTTDVNFNSQKNIQESETSNLPQIHQSTSSGSLVNGYGFYRLNFIKPFSREMARRAEYSSKSGHSEVNINKSRKGSFLVGTTPQKRISVKRNSKYYNDTAQFEFETGAKYDGATPSYPQSPRQLMKSTNPTTVTNFQYDKSRSYQMGKDKSHMKQTFSTTLNNNYCMPIDDSNAPSFKMTNPTQYQTSYDLFNKNQSKTSKNGMSNAIIKEAIDKDDFTVRSGDLRRKLNDYHHVKENSNFEQERSSHKKEIKYHNSENKVYGEGSASEFYHGDINESKGNDVFHQSKLIHDQSNKGERNTHYGNYFNNDDNDSYLRNMSVPLIRPKNFDVKVAQHDRNFRILANENIRVNSIKDNRIRNLMIRDQLLIFMDKISQLKKRMNFKEGSLKQYFKLTDQVRVNKQIELIIALCDN